MKLFSKVAIRRSPNRALPRSIQKLHQADRSKHKANWRSRRDGRKGRAERHDHSWLPLLLIYKEEESDPKEQPARRCLISACFAAAVGAVC